MDRLNQISSHLTNGHTTSHYKIKSSNDVVIVAAYRTALTKSGKGLFRDINSDEILYRLLVEFFKKVPIDTSDIGDVVVGNVLNPGAGVNEHRAAAIAAGIDPYAARLSLYSITQEQPQQQYQYQQQIQMQSQLQNLTLDSSKLSSNSDLDIAQTLKNSNLTASQKVSFITEINSKNQPSKST